MTKKLFYKWAMGWTPFPFFLALNITNRCNRRCGWCAYQSPNASDNEFNRWWKTHPKDMDFEEFYCWLKRIGWFRWFIKSVAVTGKGEPMMHPHFLGFCELLNSLRIPFTITTNADYLDDETFDYIVRMRYFKVFRIGVYEVETAQRFMGRDKVFLNNMTGKHIQGIPDPELYSMYDIPIEGALKDFNHSTTCKSPYAFLTMYTSGDVVPCYSWHVIGNAFCDTFWHILNGHPVRRFRRQAMHGRNFKDADCQNCPQNRD